MNCRIGNYHRLQRTTFNIFIFEPFLAVLYMHMSQCSSICIKYIQPYFCLSVPGLSTCIPATSVCLSDWLLKYLPVSVTVCLSVSLFTCPVHLAFFLPWGIWKDFACLLSIFCTPPYQLCYSIYMYMYVHWRGRFTWIFSTHMKWRWQKSRAGSNSFHANILVFTC